MKFKELKLEAESGKEYRLCRSKTPYHNDTHYVVKYKVKKLFGYRWKHVTQPDDLSFSYGVGGAEPIRFFSTIDDAMAWIDRNG